MLLPSVIDYGAGRLVGLPARAEDVLILLVAPACPRVVDRFAARCCSLEDAALKKAANCKDRLGQRLYGDSTRMLQWLYSCSPELTVCCVITSALVCR